MGREPAPLKAQWRTATCGRHSPPRSYQTLQEAGGPRDDDENLPHQLDDDGDLLTFGALVGLHTFYITSVNVEKSQRKINCKKQTIIIFRCQLIS